jgi:hypothetical protein
MLLYHVNLGFPLLAEGVEFVTPSQGIRWAMRDAQSEGIGHRFQAAPRTCCIEQVYLHDIAANATGQVLAGLVNRGLRGGDGVAVTVEFNKHQLPYLLEWQNFQAGSYCMAIEPSTAHPLGRSHAESHGDLLWLDHGDERTYELRFTVLSGTNEIGRFEGVVREVVPKRSSTSVAERHPSSIVAATRSKSSHPSRIGSRDTSC